MDSPSIEYSCDYSILTEHIDFQQILDGLHYPYYFEQCRHAFVRESLAIDLAQEAKNGTLVVLSQYTMRFKRSVKLGESVSVTCSAFRDAGGRPCFHLFQRMLRERKLVADAVFTATFVSAVGGRSFLPEQLLQRLLELPSLDTGAFPG